MELNQINYKEKYHNILTNNVVVIENSDSYQNELKQMNISFDMIGGRNNNKNDKNYVCNPSTNQYNQICLLKQTKDKNISDKNIFKTKNECIDECEKKFINVQLKKANLFEESIQFYLFIRDLIKKEHMKIYIKGGNVIGLAILKLIYEEYSDDDAKFEKAFNNFLKMELIKDWDFTAYTNNKLIDEKYREKLDQIAAKYKLVPRAKTFVLYQTKVPILVYDKALFEIAILDSDSTDFSKMEIPLTTMKVQVNEHSLKYIFIMAKNFYSLTTKLIPIDLNIIKKVISHTHILIHPHKNGLYDPKNKIDTGELNTNIIEFINNFTLKDQYWTQFLITQLEDPYRLIYRMPNKNIKKTELIDEFIKNNLPKTNKPLWLLDTKKTNKVFDKFIDKLGIELKKIYVQTHLFESVLDFLEGSNFGKPQIQIEWDNFESDTKNRIKKIFSPLIKQIGKSDFKKIIQTLMEKYSLDKAKPSEMTNSQKIIKFFNFLIVNKIL